MKKGSFFSTPAAKFPRVKRNAWRSLIPKSAWVPPKKVVRRAAQRPDAEAQAKGWRPDPAAERKFPVSESKTGRTIVFDTREAALEFVRHAIDTVFDEYWNELNNSEAEE